MRIKDLSVRHLSDHEIELVASHWRKQLGRFFTTNSLDGICLFEAASSFLGSRIEVHARPDGELGHDTAYVSDDRKTVVVRQSLLERARRGDARAIFDLIHELGHIVLHRALVPLARGVEGIEKVQYLRSEESGEHQANYFARAVIVTADEARLYADAEALATECCIPLDQARLRLVELTKLPEAKARVRAEADAAWEHARTIPGKIATRHRLSRGGFEVEHDQYLRPTHHYGWFVDHGAVVSYIEAKTD